MPMFSSIRFVVSGIYSILSLFFLWCGEVFRFDYVAYSSLDFPTYFSEETVFPIVYSCLLCCRLIVHISMSFFQVLNSVPLTYVSILQCHYHPVLTTVALQYSLKPESIKAPALFFFLKIDWAIQILPLFHKK